MVGLHVVAREKLFFLLIRKKKVCLFFTVLVVFTLSFFFRFYIFFKESINIKVSFALALAKSMYYDSCHC